jgi:uncharacterized membrane protein YuzA (DUF378 family)
MKRGNVIDIAYMVIGMLAFALIAMLLFKVFSEMRPGLDANPDNDYAKNVTYKTQQVLGNFNYLIIFMIIGLIGVVAISAYFIDTHPVFFVMSLLMLIGFGLVTPMLSNFYTEFSSTDTIAAAGEQFSTTGYFFSKLPMFFIIAGGIVLIAMYAKFKQPGGGL